MPRGQYERRPRLKVVETAPARSFAQLVSALPDPDPEPAPPTDLAPAIGCPTDVIAMAMRQANREGRHADAESLNAVLVKIGEMVGCLSTARERAAGDLDDALAAIAKAL